MADPAHVAQLMEAMLHHINVNPGKQQYVFICAQDGSQEDARAAGAIVARVTHVPITIVFDGGEEEQKNHEHEGKHLFSSTAHWSGTDPSVRTGTPDQ